jgi:hypothetical protein
VGWLADLLGDVQDAQEFRIARYVRATEGSWIVGGWAATLWIDGVPIEGRWDDVLRVSFAFHAALASLSARPHPLLHERIDPWAIGDRVAWNEERARPDVGQLSRACWTS